MNYDVIVAHLSDTGREREENEDSIGHISDERNQLHLLIIADGLGGTACGQIASQLAVQAIRQGFFSQEDQPLTIHQRLEYAIGEANRIILHRAGRDRQCKGMGSTCAVLVLKDDQAFVAHAGDSRIYLIRDGRIMQLTHDHTRAQRMLDDGLITEEEAAAHPDRNWLDKALGLKENLKPEIRQDPIPLEIDDTFILCTDGLTTLVRDEEIFRLAGDAPVETACQTLIELANERGGHDNVSVVMARISRK
ncbi:MAG: Stp1/IreP family PP2C-type Ser/Thr phosphatase [Acidobacteriota bacterium]|nr:MAG: Stp1/IreP family PP2C-type Ser/Thr phosphatase [Acidobacteriota bacterium]